MPSDLALGMPEPGPAAPKRMNAFERYLSVWVAASMALGGRTTRSSLKSSMDDAFRLAHHYQLGTIAVPAVGTGIAGFPIDECARVMAECLRSVLSAGWRASEVRFVLFGEDAKLPFEGAFWPAFSQGRPNSA